MILPASPIRLLIVEADRALCDLLHYVLAEAGYALAFASSLEDAPAALSIQASSLILVDLFCPSPQHLLLAAEALQQQWAPIPVGLLSSWEISPEDVRRLPVAFMLPKPFDLDQLLTAVATAVHPSGLPAPKSEQTVRTEALSACSR